MGAVKRISWKELVRQFEGGRQETKEPTYEFSGGRKFTQPNRKKLSEKPELVADGGFDTGVGWELVGSGLSVTGGLGEFAHVQWNAGFRQKGILTIGTTVLVKIEIVRLDTPNSGVKIQNGSFLWNSADGVGEYEFRMPVEDPDFMIYSWTNFVDMAIDNVSVRAL